MSTSVYQRLKAAGVPLDNHESDLYAKVTPESKAIIEEYDREPHLTWPVSTFISQVDGARWYDIPFAYEPWWEARSGK
jgi:hypothetical protein